MMLIICRIVVLTTRKTILIEVGVLKLGKKLVNVGPLKSFYFVWKFIFAIILQFSV